MNPQEELQKSVEWASKLNRKECIEQFLDLANYVTEDKKVIQNCYSMMALLDRLARLAGAPPALHSRAVITEGNDALKRNALSGKAVNFKQLSLISDTTSMKSISSEWDLHFDRLQKDAQEFVLRWNGVLSLPRISSLQGRIPTLRRAFNNSYFRTMWREGFAKMLTTPFLNGMGKQRWKADMDWFLTPPNLENIINGKYDDNKHKPTPKRDYSKDEL